MDDMTFGYAGDNVQMTGYGELPAGDEAGDESSASKYLVETAGDESPASKYLSELDPNQYSPVAEAPRGSGGVSAHDSELARTMGFNASQHTAYNELDVDDQDTFASAIAKTTDEMTFHDKAIYNSVMDPEGLTGKAGMTTDRAFASQANRYSLDLDPELFPSEEQVTDDAEEPQSDD